MFINSTALSSPEKAVLFISGIYTGYSEKA